MTDNSDRDVLRATQKGRRVRWLSGAASFIAAMIDLQEHPRGVIAHCETHSEDEDTGRFINEAEGYLLNRWLGVTMERLQSDQYADTWAVWEAKRYMSGIAGAPCTGILKREPREAFQRPDDIHVFGYTADARDVERANHFRTNYPDVSMVAPLIDQGITKAGALALLEKTSIRPPRVYAMGFSNANCIPCVKATSPDYWALVRREFPEQFERAAKLSREIGCRLARINDERVFIDEIPLDQPVTDPIAPSCDFLCHIAGQDL